MYISVSAEPNTFEPFLEYWKSLQAARRTAALSTSNLAAVPRRRDFNPMKIHFQLPFIYIVEWRSHDDVIIRLCGTGLEERFGRSLKGTNYFNFCSPEQQPFFAVLVESVVKHPCALELSRCVQMKDGTTREFSSVNFPLADDEGKPRFIVGMMNILRKAPFEGTELVGNERSVISDFGYLDIGYGTPSLPEKPLVQ